MKLETTCFGFVGLGLIGGSIAKTIKRLCPKAKIIAYNRTQSVLELAKSEGVVDIDCDKVDERFSECDYIFLCMPVSYNSEYLRLLSHVIKDGCIITDVGSVKTDIHRHVEALGLEQHFIGGHPMAGSDRTGYENATDRLLEQAYYIITPTKKVPSRSVDDYNELVGLLGSIPLILDYQEHDYFVAAISHVPHIAASSLVNLVRTSDNEQKTMQRIAAGGFRDTTRIAASSPVMWQQICMTNSEHIGKVLDAYIEILTRAKQLIAEKDSEGLYEFFEAASQYRNSIPTAFDDTDDV